MVPLSAGDGRAEEATPMNIRKTQVDAAVMQQHADAAMGMLKGLANESRLMVMCVLSEGELCVTELNKRIDLSQSALSQHLAILRAQGLVRARREGQTVFYSLVDSPAVEIIQLLHDRYCAR